MLDFKLLDIQLCGNYTYLHPLIDHWLDAKKFHLSIIESKKHLDYTVLYIVKKHHELIDVMNAFYNYYEKLHTTTLYCDHIENLHYRLKLAVPDPANQWFSDVPRLMEILVLFIVLQMPTSIKLVSVPPIFRKNNIMANPGMYYYIFIKETPRYYNSLPQYGSLIYFKNEIKDELLKHGIQCGHQDGFITFQGSYEELNKKTELIYNVLNQLGYVCT